MFDQVYERQPAQEATQVRESAPETLGEPPTTYVQAQPLRGLVAKSKAAPIVVYRS